MAILTKRNELMKKSLNLTGEKRMLLNNILRRKVNWIEHILRIFLLHDVIKVRDGSERSREKQERSHLII